MNIKPLIPAFALALLLTGCGGAEYTYPVIDGETEAEAISTTGDKLNGSLAVYFADGGFSMYDDGYTVSEEISGLVYDPPERTVMDVYSLAKASIDGGRPVMIIYTDGFGWESYEKALAAGSIPNMARFEAVKALAMFPTITPVNYASMVTGKTPKENGVTARGVHTLSCPSIFDYLTDKGGDSFISEGDTQIIAFSVSQELNPDTNGDGSTDDEVFNTAIAAVSGGYELLFVHFHGIDDTSHACGPAALETREAISAVDAYIGRLAEAWDGDIIIVSDHGQHENDGGGDDEYAGKKGSHGAFTSEDIFVPLLTGGTR